MVFRQTSVRMNYINNLPPMRMIIVIKIKNIKYTPHLKNNISAGILCLC